MTDPGIEAELEANRRRAGDGDGNGDGEGEGDVPGGSIGVVTGELLRPAGVDSADRSDTAERRAENDSEQRPE